MIAVAPICLLLYFSDVLVRGENCRYSTHLQSKLSLLFSKMPWYGLPYMTDKVLVTHCDFPLQGDQRIEIYSVIFPSSFW